MRRPARCPICKDILRQEDVEFADSFSCPHCGGLLSHTQSGTGQVAGLVMLLALMFGFFEGVYGLTGYILALLVLPLLTVILNRLLTYLFGYTLDTAEQVGLGDITPHPKNQEPLGSG